MNKGSAKLPQVFCRGEPREMGQQQGAALRDGIHALRCDLARLEPLRLRKPAWLPYGVYRWLAERRAAPSFGPSVTGPRFRDKRPPGRNCRGRTGRAQDYLPVQCLGAHTLAGGWLHYVRTRLFRGGDSREPVGDRRTGDRAELRLPPARGVDRMKADYPLQRVPPTPKCIPA